MAGKWMFQVNRIGPDDYLWLASRDGADRVLWGREETADEANKAADAAAVAYDAPKPPADPAWMVEVATAADTIVSAKTPGMFEAAMCVLRLALERGHVVERRPADEEPVCEDDPLFAAVFRAIKGWDIGDSSRYGGYCSATGDHARIIVRAVRALIGPRSMPTEEEMLVSAREDARQIYDSVALPVLANEVQLGLRDDDWAVLAALQARRNMLREMGANFREQPARVDWAAEAPKMARKAVLNAVRPNGDIATFYTAGEPGRVDLEAALKRAWDAGFIDCRVMLVRKQHQIITPDLRSCIRSSDVSSILSTLPAKE